MLDKAVITNILLESLWILLGWGCMSTKTDRTFAVDSHDWPGISWHAMDC